MQTLQIIARPVVGAVIGGILGFAYYKMVGCPTGACPIASNPVASIIYGAVLGAVIAGSMWRPDTLP